MRHRFLCALRDSSEKSSNREVLLNVINDLYQKGKGQGSDANVGCGVRYSGNAVNLRNLFSDKESERNKPKFTTHADANRLKESAEKLILQEELVNATTLRHILTIGLFNGVKEF